MLPHGVQTKGDKMKRIAIFFGSLAVCAGIAWLGGYNFDTRNFWVAYGAVFAVFFSGFAAITLGEIE